jgi:DNA-binding Xre family transcriptional regulator
MPVIDVRALQRVMTQQNYLFKHQLANLVGISYERLTEILVNGDTDVDEDIVRRLCIGLECEPDNIIAQNSDAKTVMPPPAGMV